MQIARARTGGTPIADGGHRWRVFRWRMPVPVKDQIVKALWIGIVTLAFLLVPAALSRAATILTP